MKKESKANRLPGRRGRALPDDACPTCGTTMIDAEGSLHQPVCDEEITVASASYQLCQKCGEIVLGLPEAQRVHEAAVAIYRRQHGMLSADEIRAIREQFELTEVDLAQLLRLEPITISRWEAGRNAQTAAMDMLLRLIRDLPGSIEYLREHAA